MIRGELDGDAIWSASHMVPENRQPAIQDEVPWDMTITDYDKEHFTCYVRLLDACAAGASDAEMCRIILSIDAAKEPGPCQARARQPSETCPMDDRTRLSPSPAMSDSRPAAEEALISARHQIAAIVDRAPHLVAQMISRVHPITLDARFAIQ